MNIIDAIKENYKPLLPAQDYTLLKRYIDDESSFALIQWGKDKKRFKVKIFNKEIAKLALTHVSKFIDWNNFRTKGSIKCVYAGHAAIKQDTPNVNIFHGDGIAKELSELLGKGEFDFSEKEKVINFKLQSKESNDNECRNFISELTNTLIAMSVVYEVGLYIYDLYILGPTNYMTVGRTEYRPSGKKDEVCKILDLIQGNKCSELILAKYYTLLQSSARPYIILGYSFLEEIYYDSSIVENIINFKEMGNGKKLKSQLKQEVMTCIDSFCSKYSVPYNKEKEANVAVAIENVINCKDKTKNDVIKYNLHKSIGGEKDDIDGLVSNLFKIRSPLSHQINIDPDVNLSKYIKQIKSILDNEIAHNLSR
ncbi:MAG: hypothetical protein JW743_08700 [Deltaproteobacteria bacterium]|nr:hypothetical protein [Deltaproteobacteria bacterium]MBN2844572.1 hypothetical protein [Deltaproteobacteria bacterium]